MQRRSRGQWSDAGISLVGGPPLCLPIGQSEMELEAGEPSAGNGEIEQWRLVANYKVYLLLQKCNCETFRIFIETFPIQ